VHLDADGFAVFVGEEKIAMAALARAVNRNKPFMAAFPSITHNLVRLWVIVQDMLGTTLLVFVRSQRPHDFINV
jgi:hypothetical protein